MTETWLPFAERRDGPAWKQGYPSVARRSLSMIYGQTDHDAAGPWGALLGEIMNPARFSSWTVAVPETNRLASGKLCVEHYPLEAITWHAGKRGAPAINSFDPSLLGNVTLLGIENADDGSGRLTDYQEMVWEEISQFLRANCPNVASRLPAPRVTHWWHQWLSSTTCPNGRVIYERLMPRLEEDMDQETFNKLFKHAVDHVGLDSVDDMSLGVSVNATRDQIIAAIDALDLGEVNYEKLAKALLKEMA